MAHSSDTPILQALVPAGDDLLMALDVSTNPPIAKKLRLNQIGGLTPEDVTVAAAGAQTISTRVMFIASGAGSTPVNIPAPSGALREVIVMNGGSGAAVITSAAANIRGFLSTTQTAATTNSIAANAAATFLSDGTTWFRVR